MVIDTSAIMAIFLGEPEVDGFDEAIGAAKIRLLPATCLFEARIVLVARRDERSVDDLDLARSRVIYVARKPKSRVMAFTSLL